MRALAHGGKFDAASKSVVRSGDAPLGFADELYGVIKAHVVGWATGPSSFVVVALLESEEFGEAGRKELLASLKKSRKVIEKAAKGEEGKGKDGAVDGKKAKGARGNAGARMLLEKLG